MNEKKGFPLEKILKISAKQYFLDTGKNPEDYHSRPIGMQGMEVREFGIDDNYNHEFDAYAEIIRSIPAGTEVVVDFIDDVECSGTLFRSNPQKAYHYKIRGTALIPK